jgi:uncharacterized protein YfaP (DUF2135 family)
MKTAATIVICLFFSSLIYGQGSIPMNKKSFIGALEFLPNGKLAEGYPRVKSAYPMHIDPVIDPKNWYVENNQQMSGMLGDAVLFIEWWTKATSPSERYKFDWTSSGYFEVNYVNDKGENKYQRIDRYKLEKYPNLVQRFDNITPIDINFEITFHAGSRPDKEYYAFRKRYNIMEDLGSAGYAVNYTRKLNGDFILYKPSRKKQDWINPGIVQGGWNTFLNMPDKYKDKESRLIELFKMGTTLEISSFGVSDIKWRMSDFIYIAKKFEDYETGKDKPTAFDEVANGEQENKAGDGFWDETTAIPCAIDLTNDFNNKITKEGVINFSGKVTGPKSLIKSGKVIAEGYEQDFEIDENGNFAVAVVLSAGLNKVKLSVCSKVIEQNITLNRDPVDLRVTLTWDKGASDIDLYLYDPESMVCFYKNKTASNMQLDVDNTLGYGPENIFVKKVKKGTYRISINNFKNGENAEATVYVFINEKLKDIHKVPIGSQNREIIVKEYNFN